MTEETRTLFSANPQPVTKRRVDADGPDFYPTPPWATAALLKNERFGKHIWEPACGDGAMAAVLREFGHEVLATDLIYRGHGEGGRDFLTEQFTTSRDIVTNPPYNLAEQFVHKAMAMGAPKAAFLLRLAFLESARRYESIWSKTPPARVWVFSERITFYPNGERTGGSGTTAYGWFVWDRSHVGGTELKWLTPGER